MRTTTKRSTTGVLVALLSVLALAMPVDAADERDSAYFSNSGQVCIEGINATNVIWGGLRFQSATRSLHLNCITSRALPHAFITTATGIRAVDGSAGTSPYCGYAAIGFNPAGSSRADAPYVSLTGSQVRSICGIPSGHFAAGGAYSLHEAVIYGSWSQQGFVVGTVSNLI